MAEYAPPTQDEIQRVAAYWQRVKRIACKHESGMTFDGSCDRPKCSDCDEPLHFFTPTQIEELRAKAPMSDEVRGSLLKQLDRGGVVFAVDGEWHEVRLEVSRPHPTSPPEEERIVMPVEAVKLLLQATESRTL